MCQPLGEPDRPRQHHGVSKRDMAKAQGKVHNEWCEPKT